MHDPGYMKNRLPHGSLWSHGLDLAEAEIGRRPAPSGRWTRKPGGSAGAASRVAAVAAGPWPREAWTLETGPSSRGTEAVEGKRWAAQPA